MPVKKSIDKEKQVVYKKEVRTRSAGALALFISELMLREFEDCVRVYAVREQTSGSQTSRNARSRDAKELLRRTGEARAMNAHADLHVARLR